MWLHPGSLVNHEQLKQIQDWVNDRLSWTCEGTSQVRVFAIPPDWSRLFYDLPIAQACAYVTPEREDNPSSMVWVSIGSTGEHSIVFQGPWESSDKAHRRLTRLLQDLQEPYIPSLEALLDAAGNSGCSVELW